MWEWIQTHEVLAWWLLIISIVTFVATLIAVPYALVRLPADYFATRDHPAVVDRNQHPVLQFLWQTLKTVLGLTLILLGVAMLVLPGQGIITILVGIMLLKFPKKYELERWMVSRQRVLSSINWLRRRYGREPLIIERCAESREG